MIENRVVLFNWKHVTMRAIYLLFVMMTKVFEYTLFVSCVYSNSINIHCLDARLRSLSEHEEA